MSKIIMGILMLLMIQTSVQAETPTHESVTKLYVATFNRAPLKAGLDYWVYESGLILEDVAMSFFDQEETKAKYPADSTVDDFIIAVYANLFNREPAPAGLEYWGDEIRSGNIEKSVFILAVINGAKDTAISNDATILANKTIVGLAFANAGLIDKQDASDIMLGITDDPETVADALDMINEVLTGPFLLSFCGVTNGNELWKSDGTAVGTMEVKDIYTGSQSSNPDYLTYVDATLFFSADQFSWGTELWKSDGTTDGTLMVKDIYFGESATVKFLTNVDGTLYFRAQDGTFGEEIWKSDGTETGTVMVADIKDGASGSNPTFLTNFDGTLFFQANNGDGNELWKSDGTKTGTVKVKDDLLNVQHLEVSNHILFFRANYGGGDELFRTDGTSAGTVMVADIDVTGGSNPNRLTDVDGKLFFAADDNVHGNELWKSDGTDAGTVLVKDINAPGPSSLAGSSPDELANIDGTLFFTASTLVNGRELWKSDGTETGTILVKDINVGSDSNATELTNVNGTVFFSADDGVNGRELWKSDGTATGTVMVKDILDGPLSSNPHDLQNLNGLLYFKTNDNNTTEELWTSDGTSAGTLLVKEGCTL